MRRQLGQSRPSDTNAASILNNERPWAVNLIMVCSSTANDTTFSIYHDADGTTYDESTALYFNAPIRSNDVAYLELPTPITNVDSTGNLAVKSGEASGLTFTVYGEILGERL